jgi:hypothetical protein
LRCARQLTRFRRRGGRLRFRPADAGSYYLQASGADGAIGDNKISIRRE